MRSKHLDAIRAALLHEWDPIGVRDDPEAQGEYDSYAGMIYKLLLNSANQDAIFDYLWYVETLQLGLPGNRKATEKFAARLIELWKV